MGPQQPSQAPGAATQQIYRQLQLTVNEALKVLDAARPVDPASQPEVDSLRSLIWSELTGLEAEFAREDGPRADRTERFFYHLLSSGEHVGQIEALGSTLLGGVPLPTQPPPESPVAGLHRLHGTMNSLRRQWQQATQPAPAMSSAPTGADGWKRFFKEADLDLPENQAPIEEPIMRERRAPPPRPLAPPVRRGNGSSPERLFEDLGLGGQNAPITPLEPDIPRPRVLISFVTVFVILGLMGIGVIYLGLNSDAQTDAGSLLGPNTTVTAGPAPSGTVLPTATLNPAPPQLLILGNPLEVPCPGTNQAASLVLENTGGKVLAWNARVNPLPTSSQPVALSATSGQLYGAGDTNIVTINVTAQVTHADGTITITTNIPGSQGTQSITYHISGC